MFSLGRVGLLPPAPLQALLRKRPRGPRATPCAAATALRPRLCPRLGRVCARPAWWTAWALQPRQAGARLGALGRKEVVFFSFCFRLEELQTRAKNGRQILNNATPFLTPHK